MIGKVNQGHFAATGTAPCRSVGDDRRPLVVVAQSAPEGICELLALYDVSATVAASGEDLVDLAVMARPRVIFVDSTLRGIDAIEAVRLIRAIGSLAGIRIVFLAEYPERGERVRALESGCDEYLAKPIDLDRIDESLERHLFGRRGN